MTDLAPTGRHRARGRRRRWALAVAVAGAVVASGVGWAVASAHPVSPSRPVAARTSTTSVPASPPTSSPTSPVPRIPPIPGGPQGPAHDAPTVVPAAPPVLLTVAAIGVRTTLQPLGLLPDGSLQSPTEWQQAGWYADGVRPGDRGPAVIAGHVDSVSGPAVFYRLRDLRPGADVVVQEQDGRVLHFTVDRTDEYPKAQFPTQAVYGPTGDAELRLITCTGDFDRRAHSYVDNLVVSAHLA